jgi:sugar-specific transcriptional regulator TrmB
MNSSSTLEHIVDELEHHEDAIRVKKLMVYACKNYWENDPRELAKVSVRSLVEELRNLNTSIESLRDSMNRTVETLNRPEVYATVANLIITNFTDLYNDSDDTTQIIVLASKQQNQNLVPDSIIDQVAHNLEQDKDVARIKKLIFYACKQRWENSMDVLLEYELSDLVYELRQKNETLEQLKYNLNKIVGTLNRQAVYSYVANIVIQELEILYQDHGESTEILGASPAPSVPIADADSGEETGVLSPPTKVRQNRSKPDNSNTEEQAKTVEQQAVYDPFAVKIEIMRYANPLRAKIVLFSVFYHPFDQSGQDWAILRTCELDELLSEIYRQSETIVQVESYLANAVKNMTDPEIIGAAKSIVQALKPFYPKP